MARTASTFRQNDVTRAVKAAIVAGVEVVRVEISNGKIIIISKFGDAMIAVNDAAGEMQ